MNDNDYQVAGVLPPTFEPLISEHYYQRADIWAPLGYEIGGDSACRSCQHLRAIGRLKPGATVASAERDVNRVHDGVRARFPRRLPDVDSHRSDVARRRAAGRNPSRARGPDGGRAVRPLDCLRERREPAAGAHFATRARPVASGRARREPHAARAPAAGRERHRRLDWRRDWRGARRHRGPPHRAADTVCRAAARRRPSRSAPGGVWRRARPPSPRCSSDCCRRCARRAPNLTPALAGDGRRTASAPTSLARRLLVADRRRTRGRPPRRCRSHDSERLAVDVRQSRLRSRARPDVADVDERDAVRERFAGRPDRRRDSRSASARFRASKARRWPDRFPSAATSTPAPSTSTGVPVSADDLQVERYSVTPEYFSVMRIPLVRGRLIAEADRVGSGTRRGRRRADGAARLAGQDAIGQRVRIGSATRDPSPSSASSATCATTKWPSRRRRRCISAASVHGFVLSVVVRTQADPAARGRRAPCRVVGRRRCAGVRCRDAVDARREVRRLAAVRHGPPRAVWRRRSADDGRRAFTVSSRTASPSARARSASAARSARRVATSRRLVLRQRARHRRRRSGGRVCAGVRADPLPAVLAVRRQRRRPADVRGRHRGAARRHARRAGAAGRARHARGPGRRAPPGLIAGPALQSAAMASAARGRVLAFAFLLAVVTYLDRICISTAAPSIMKDLDLSSSR